MDSKPPPRRCEQGYHVTVETDDETGDRVCVHCEHRIEAGQWAEVSREELEEADEIDEDGDYPRG